MDGLRKQLNRLLESKGVHYSGWRYRRGPFKLKALKEVLSGIYQSLFGTRRIYHNKKNHWRAPPGTWVFYKDLSINFMSCCDSEICSNDYFVFIGEKLAFHYERGYMFWLPPLEGEFSNLFRLSDDDELVSYARACIREAVKEIGE